MRHDVRASKNAPRIRGDQGGNFMPRLSKEGLDLIFRNARTFTRYTDEPVTDSQLDEIWELMKYGPTSANLLPARIVWCKSQEAKDKLATFATPENVVPIQTAPVTAIIAMDMRFFDYNDRLFPLADVRSWFEGSEDQVREPALRNSTLQGAYFIIAARAIGLDTGAMSGFDNVAVDEAFFSGTTHKSNFLCTVGHGDRSSLHERMPRPPFDWFNTII
jgi:3-hydroxypropanoate dehydrogenase